MTEKKGFGLRAERDMPKSVVRNHRDPTPLTNCDRDSFVYEYVGDVVNTPSFKKRMREYGEEGIQHFYFMMLQKDEVGVSHSIVNFKCILIWLHRHSLVH
jgi:hypothetical protein